MQEDKNKAWCGTPMVNKLEEEMRIASEKKKQKEEQEDEFGTDFLSDKFKEADKKVESGEISCNLDDPEDCEACGS